MDRLDCCERRRRSLNVFFGDTYGTEICRLQISPAASVRRLHLGFHCPSAKLAIELDGGGHNYRAGQIRDRSGRNSSRAMESLYCDSGIIRFAENSIASCEQSGSHSRSDRKTLTFILSLWQRERRSLTGVQFEISYASCRCASTWQARSNTSFRRYVRDTRHHASPRCGERIEVRGCAQSERRV